MKKIIILFLLCIFMMSAAAGYSRTVDKVAAVVNNHAITLSELHREMILNAPKFDLQGKPNTQILQNSRLKKETIDEMINDILILDEIKKRGLEVSDSSLEMFIRNMMQQNRLKTKEELVSALALQNMTLEEYKKNLRKQIEKTKIMNYAVRTDVHVSDNDLKNYYMQNMEEARQPDSMHLRNIFIAKNKKKDAKNKADEVIKKLKAKAKFESVVKEYSDDSNAKSGGDLGFLTVKDLNPQILAEVSKLKPGQSTGIIDTAAGYYIFNLVDKKKGQVQEFEQIKEELRKKLLSDETERKFKAWLSNVRSKSFIDIKI